MSRESPTPEEMKEIEAFLNGVYGSQPPTWFTDPPAGTRFLTENQWREKLKKQAILVRDDGTIMGPYKIVSVETATLDDGQTEVTAMTLERKQWDANEC